MIENIKTKEAFITINTKKCTGCGNCTIVCGGDVFEIKKKKAAVAHIEYCLECGNCEVACMRNAITFMIPNGGTGVVYKYG